MSKFIKIDGQLFNKDKIITVFPTAQNGCYIGLLGHDVKLKTSVNEVWQLLNEGTQTNKDTGKRDLSGRKIYEYNVVKVIHKDTDVHLYDAVIAYDSVQAAFVLFPMDAPESMSSEITRRYELMGNPNYVYQILGDHE